MRTHRYTSLHVCVDKRSARESNPKNKIQGDMDMSIEESNFQDINDQLEAIENDIRSGKNTKSDKPRRKKELRYRISTPEDEMLILTFEEVCRNTQREPRAVLFNLIDQWVRNEGAKLYGVDEIARKLEGE